jgi:hypothetical protein
LRFEFHGSISRQGKFDDGFRFGVEGNQICVNVDRTTDVIREDVPEGVVEGILHLGLKNFTCELIGHSNQKSGTDEPLGLGEDNKATLAG